MCWFLINALIFVLLRSGECKEITTTFTVQVSGGLSRAYLALVKEPLLHKRPFFGFKDTKESVHFMLCPPFVL